MSCRRGGKSRLQPMAGALRSIRLTPEQDMLIDTHVHFDEFLAGGEEEAVLERAVLAGVERMVAVGGSRESNCMAVDMARAHPDRIRAAIGYARDQAQSDCPAGDLEKLLGESAAAAIGETGLDFERDPTPRHAQIALFDSMLDLALRRRLPVVVHCRNAEDAVAERLRRHSAAWPGRSDRIGVLHCFTGSTNFALEMTALGFHVSFSGILTFRNAKALRASAAAVPENRLLIETDSPFLSPEPFRGERNEPARLGRVAETLAVIRGMTPGQIETVTARNAINLFWG